ncbi:MAG: winged helix-turn-helix domain-containing protein [Acidobacteriia bacterium]|nr:winged helix-turn-helix domain-containing protein [Terriglobia bacterium]
MSSQAARQGHPVQYRFADFLLCPQQAALWKAGVRISLTPKPLATLIVLVEHAGKTVSKEAILSAVWGGLAVEENNLTQCISTLRKTLGEKRGENRFIATEPGTGYRFVAPVVTSLAINEQQSPVKTDDPLPQPRATPRRWIALLVAAACVCIAAAFFWSHRKVTNGTAGHRSVAVLDIRNLSKDGSEAWLAMALPEMLTSELASDSRLRAIPSDDLVRWRSDLGSTALRSGQAELIRLAQRSLGADTFVLGSYVVIGVCPDCRIRVDLRVYDASTGGSLATIIDEDGAPNLLDLAARLGLKLRSVLGANGALPPPSWPAASAMRHYAEGLDALRRVDPTSATDHLQTALAADPGNALIHAASADAWAALGYVTRAKQESLAAFQLSKSLSSLEQLGIEARYRISLQQWDRAIDIYQKVFAILPDSLEDGLNLARAQYRGNKNADASATLQKLRQLPKPAGNDPRIDLIEAQNAGVSRDFVKTRDYAHRAAMEAKARGARYVYARSRLLEGGAMQTLRDPDFLAVQTDARQVCESIGDRECVSQAWRIRGNARFFQGDFTEAEAAYDRGAAVARELGDRAELANLLNGLGVVAESKQDWPAAEKNFQEAIGLKKETGYNPSEVQVQLAYLYLRLGRLRDSARVTEEALAEARKVDAHEDLGELLFVRASQQRAAGQLAAAQRSAEQAIEELRFSRSNSLPLAQAGLSSILTARGDLANAERALAGASAAGSSGSGAIELARAELLFAKNQFQQASDEARRSADDFTRARETGSAAMARVVEAKSLDMLGNAENAQHVAEETLRTPGLAAEPVAVSWARLTVWRLTDQLGFRVPPALHSDIANLKDPELSLEEDFDRAVRAKRAGMGEARQLFRELANCAADQDYLTISRRARRLE